MDVGCFLKSANIEIKKMNEGKVGALPFQYSDSYIHFLAFLKISFKIPYHTVQGILRGLSDYVRIVEETHFMHTRKVILKVKPFTEEMSFEKDYDCESITMIVDNASGLTVSKKGDYYIEEKRIRKKKESLSNYI